MKLLLQLKDICKNYGAQVILADATLSIYEGQKIGVIGRNGAGKSTLCKIITGQEKQSSGTVSTSSSFRFAYLEQHDPYMLDETVIGFLQRYTKKPEWQCGKLAARFQLKNELVEKTLGELPGGYRTRVKLTAMLLGEPNFLILDEPSNYLDLKTLILLEEFLSDFRGGFLIVSHDREFLKKTCKNTLEIEHGSFSLYPGSVDQFLLFKEEQVEHALKYNKNVETKVKQLQQFVDRFRAKNTKATQAKSKMKQIEKLQTIEVGHPLQNVRIKIPSVIKKKTFALKTDDLEIGYPDKTVAENISLEVLQGAHVSVLGDNGEGKTTFLRTLAEDLVPKKGTFKWGHNLSIGYYAQHVSSVLDETLTVQEHLSLVADSSVSAQEVLNFAGSFLFKGDEVKKKISVLSGGEKARLYLAGLLLKKNQVLLLDEPTNHLDFETVEALGEALKHYDGTLFFVSHDRTFVNMVTTEVLEISQGKITNYPGTYEEYVYFLEKSVREELSTETKETVQTVKKEKSPYQLKQELKAQRRGLLARLREAEKRAESHKKEYDEIHQLFVEDVNAWSYDKNDRYEKLAKLIDADELLWLELHEELDKINQLLDGDSN